MRADNVLQTIGNTPQIRINRLFGNSHQVWIKSERSNPGGSIKDRTALAMVEAAERSDVLQPGGTIIEPTSGNTGVGQMCIRDSHRAHLWQHRGRAGAGGRSQGLQTDFGDA